LNYLGDNFEKYYRATYNPAAMTVPFLPVLTPDREKPQLASPFDCYSDPACLVMDFKLLHPSEIVTRLVLVDSSDT